MMLKYSVISRWLLPEGASCKAVVASIVVLLGHDIFTRPRLALAEPSKLSHLPRKAASNSI